MNRARGRHYKNQSFPADAGIPFWTLGIGNAHWSTNEHNSDIGSDQTKPPPEPPTDTTCSLPLKACPLRPREANHASAGPKLDTEDTTAPTKREASKTPAQNQANSADRTSSTSKATGRASTTLATLPMTTSDGRCPRPKPLSDHWKHPGRPSTSWEGLRRARQMLTQADDQLPCADLNQAGAVQIRMAWQKVPGMAAPTTGCRRNQQ